MEVIMELQVTLTEYVLIFQKCTEEVPDLIKRTATEFSFASSLLHINSAFAFDA